MILKMHLFWRVSQSLNLQESLLLQIGTDSRSQVHCNLIRRDENCPEPQKRQLPFQGVGRTLGSSSTPAISEPSASAPISTAPATFTSILDESLPSTSLQIRLVDGTRMVAHFNFRQTIGDIRAFIDASWPIDIRAYQLQELCGYTKNLMSCQKISFHLLFRTDDMTFLSIYEWILFLIFVYPKLIYMKIAVVCLKSKYSLNGLLYRFGVLFMCHMVFFSILRRAAV